MILRPSVPYAPTALIAGCAALGLSLSATGLAAQETPQAGTGQAEAGAESEMQAITPEVIEPDEQAGADESGPPSECDRLPDHATLTEVLRAVVAPGDEEANGGLGNQMWATLVDRSGVVCAIARSGEAFADQWPGSRMISAQKAYAANAFSLPQFALSTANLYWPAQPRNSLYGLPTGNPVAAGIYEGDASDWGTPGDPVAGQRLGGTTVFAGGLALYTSEGELVGGLGLSGDESCTDHVIAWKMRHRFNLDNVPAGVTDEDNDNIIHDITTDPASGRDESDSGYGHPTCSPRAETIALDFARTHPTGPDD